MSRQKIIDFLTTVSEDCTYLMVSAFILLRHSSCVNLPRGVVVQYLIRKLNSDLVYGHRK